MKKIRNNFARNLSFIVLFVMMVTNCIYGRTDDFISESDNAVSYYVEAAAAHSQVYVCGTPIGIKMNSDGVIVTGFIGFKNEEDMFVNPCFDAGFMIGDRIISVYGEAVHNTEDLKNSVETNQGLCNVNVVRNNQLCTLTVTPEISAESHMNKLGLWVKDDAAGIGTLTYVNPETGEFGALGHGIGGIETGGLFEMSDGTLYNAAIGGSVSGKVGAPGELRGYFLEADGSGVGTVEINSDKGVYGKVNQSDLNSLDKLGTLMPVASYDKVHTGNAKILSTVSGTEPEWYDIEIKSLNTSNNEDVKSMVIHITDMDLISKTGGIVQGMSGSPIIQDGNLVGAVTHVLINDPTTGYGIFIESMLDAARN